MTVIWTELSRCSIVLITKVEQVLRMAVTTTTPIIKKPNTPLLDPASAKRAKREDMGRQDQLL